MSNVQCPVEVNLAVRQALRKLVLIRPHDPIEFLGMVLLQTHYMRNPAAEQTEAYQAWMEQGGLNAQSALAGELLSETKHYNNNNSPFSSTTTTTTRSRTSSAGSSSSMEDMLGVATAVLRIQRAFRQFRAFALAKREVHQRRQQLESEQIQARKMKVKNRTLKVSHELPGKN